LRRCKESEEPPVYRLVAAVKTQNQQKLLRKALPRGKIMRLYIANVSGRNTLQEMPATPSHEEILLLDLQANGNGDALDCLKQFDMLSLSIIHADPADTYQDNIERGDNALNKEFQDYLSASDIPSKSSQYAILRRKHYFRLVKELETARAERERLQALPEMLSDGILVVNNEGLVLYANPAICDIFQRPTEQLLGCPFGHPICSDGDVEITVLRPGGQKGIVEMRSSAIIWNGEPALLASLRDVTEQKLIRHDLEYLATHDGLTRLYNHRAFYTMLKDELSRSQRYNHSLSLFVLDIDHFKQVNDTFGHQAGDEILRGLSNLLMEQARDTDRVCRYGGEEITVIMPEIRVGDAVEVANRFRKAIEAHGFDLGEGKKASITVSIGVASYPLHAKTTAELVKAADSALYTAKKSGRNCVYNYAQIASKDE